MSVRDITPLFSWGFSLRKSKWLVPLFSNNVFSFGNSAVNGPYGWNSPGQKRTKTTKASSTTTNSNSIGIDNEPQIREKHTIIDNTSSISTETPSGVILEPSFDIATDLSKAEQQMAQVSSEFSTKATVTQTKVNPEAPCAINHTVTKAEKSGKYFEKTDGEIIDALDRGDIKHYNLEKLIAKNTDKPAPEECTRAVKLRRMYLASQIETGSTQEAMKTLPFENYNYGTVFGQCCENVVGYVPIPVGVVGPFVVDGKEIHVPMATTEGCLIASAQRGAKALSVNGVNTVVLNDGMTRGPALQMPNATKAAELKQWLEDNFDKVAKEFNSTSNFARLKEMKCAIAGRKIFIRFKCSTGDAMGMNMISKAVTKSIEFLQTQFPEMQVLAVSGNYCTDKKPSSINWIEGRGKSVVADCVIPKQVVKDVLKTDVEALCELNVSKNLIGSALAGAIGGNNAHASNIVTAVYLATGQDAAQNVESSNCLTLMEKTEDGDLYISCSMPSIEVGTVGGGTILEAQSSMLDLLGVKGSHKEKPGANAQQLARIVCATVMAGEVSLMSALASGDLVKAHLQFNRKK